MKRLLLLLAFAVPVANAQILTTTTPTTASTASQVQALAPQLVAFAGGDANFAALVNGLAVGAPVTLTTPLANGGTQSFTFTPAGTMSAVQIAQTLETARQSLISRGIAAPTAQQIGVALTGGTLTTPGGSTAITPLLAGATLGTTPAAGASASTQSPATAIQAGNAASGGSATGVRNMSDSPNPRGISDTPPLPVPGVTSPAPNTVATEAPRVAAPAAPAPAAPATLAPPVRLGDR
jgi:hypothetical protein